MYVTKRNGDKEVLDIVKNTKSLEWATKDLENVSISDIQMGSKLHLYEGIKTKDIHQVMIATVRDKVTLKSPEYDKVLANLYIQKIYKEAYNSITVPSILEYLDMSEKLRYPICYTRIKKYYKSEVLQQLNSKIVHERDFDFTGSGMEQIIDKYILKRDGRVIETPNMMYMLIALDVFAEQTNRREEYVVALYDLLSLFMISLPTPMMRSLRTASTDYASCVTINIGDSIDSWVTGFTSIVEHTVASAGGGIDISSVSSKGVLVKDETIEHPGKIPLMKVIDACIQVSSQNGRRGAATVFVNIFDPEIESILTIKSPRTEVSKRINDLKHGIKFSDYFYKLIMEGKPISLINSREYPGLYDLYHSKDQHAFIQIYEQLVKDGRYDSQIDGRELMELFIGERFENGIYYVINIDEINRYAPFLEPITQSNLCVEFIAPTKPVTSLQPDSPDIGICILSNINQGRVSKEKLPHVTDVLVRTLNSIIHRQNHPTSQANAYVRDYATLGIGFSNHAYYLAKNGVKFGSKLGLELHNTWMEHFQYNLLRASNNVAREIGTPNKYNMMSYANGTMPLDRYKHTVNELVPHSSGEVDWDGLKVDILSYGLANCGLSMVPPSETSSSIGSQTSGMEPIRDLITIKGSKTTNTIQLAPEAIRLADKYDYAFDREITKDFMKHIAVTQKWIDMGISGNTFYNPDLYPDKKVPLKLMIEDVYYAKYYGIKTLYYNNTYVRDEEDHNVKPACDSGGCEV